MCIGIPMQVVWSEAHVACCRLNGKTESVDISLVGEQPEGTWLLVFLGAARSVLDADTAVKTLAALQALTSVAAGEDSIDHLFPDLHNREPWLPDHLRSAADPAPLGSNSQPRQLPALSGLGEKQKDPLPAQSHVSDVAAAEQNQQSDKLGRASVNIAKGPLS